MSKSSNKSSCRQGKTQKVDPSYRNDTPEVDDMDDDVNDAADLQLCSDIREKFELFVQRWNV